MARHSGLVRFAAATIAAFLCNPVVVSAQQPSIFSFSSAGTGLQLGGSDLAPEIHVAPNDLPGVKRVASDLAADFGRVLGVNGTVVVADWDTTVSKSSPRPVILLGTIGQSSLIDTLASKKLLDTAAVASKWETFSYQVISKPWDGRDAVFVIAGSDMRGTVFGAYDVAEQIGVSPWHYWGDVPPTKRQYIWASNAVHTEGPPSVKYRGIFLNDEAPGLTGWGGKRFQKSQYGSPFVTDFYKHIFDLVLRLKGNYLWPAMWSSMFYLDDTKNGPTATEYGIFMGTSHHEPMARADKEQGRFLNGAWDWSKNKAGVKAFMEAGVTRAKNWSTVYTLGMRGSGDAASPTLTSNALQEVIQWQQSALKSILGKSLSDVPQAWVMYKEVPGYWQKGMDVSEDVTLLWSDDNRGNIRRIPIGTEGNRRGGAGMYYHFDYVGSPRNYKWINTIQLQKTWEQMTLAYDSGVHNIWIANVGDLKGLELPTAHFMALAWDRAGFADGVSTSEWLRAWSARQFGESAAEAATSIMTTYGKLTARMKYEDLSKTPFAFSTLDYDEAELNFNEWTDLLTKAQAVYDGLTAELRTPFFEIVLHPVMAGRGVYEIYTKTALGSKYANEHRTSANRLGRDVQAAFTADAAIAKRYHGLRDGKWDGIMAQTHIGYDNWQEPSANSLPKLSWVTTAAKNAIMGVSAQGSTASFPGTASLKLPAINPYKPSADQRWLEVYTRDNGTFTYSITSNASFMSVSNSKQTLSSPSGTSDSRSILTVNWDSAPSGYSVAALTVTNLDATSAKATILVPIENYSAPASFKGHVEANGVVSIEAEHYAPPPESSPDYMVIPEYGRTLSGVKLPAKTASQSPGEGPVLVYPFYTFTNASSASLTVYLSPSDNANPTSPNRYSFSVDGGSVTTVQPVPLTDQSQDPPGWTEGVTQNAYVKKSSLGKRGAGWHTLKIWLLEPTMVLTKVVVDVGGLKTSLMGPPESVMVGY
ncbi:hypothetical protein C8A00DRAFT_17270 [Chaetomidium leptoderma]|uniref:Gylcosyl hydrolase 115 C-terminal domain-containing protein n=1 Tax=Chaetomidium leptoderma TaxID=669021 RepID=A0AAN6VJG2_9PEZI|nr:hypothetical protein C8A00DRAFT_17270 [Chaetomidium leptoderma]